MCRLFGVLSASEISLGEYLLEAPLSLAKQSEADPNQLQADGWGVGYYERRHSRVIKSPGYLAQEREEAREKTRGLYSRMILGHVRRASNPRNLPKEALIGLEHTQPFHFGPHLFAHNGTLLIPDAVHKELGAYASRVQGKNDSEVLFWLLIKMIEELQDVPQGLAKALELIHAVHERLPSSEKPPQPATGLNILYSDGRTLYGFCHYPKGDTHKALSSPERPYYTMVTLVDEDRVFMASEPLFSGSWQDFDRGELAQAQIRPKPELVKLAVHGD